MKSLIVFSLILVSMTVSAQQTEEPILEPNLEFKAFGFKLLGDSSMLYLGKPKIQMEGDFYTILQSPNVRRKHALDNMSIKNPDFIPHFQVAPLNPFDDYYLLDLNPVVIPSPDK